ncbi:MAG: pyridoxal-phosphate dependent enzyme [Phycisphaerae bacterium]|nr:pyridoxal-phosphate dependent enzyme [Phycisphaerae bacterium]MDZ4831976.1 pyridoxal-phosphate dependent enzyme [Phycisphaerae bacterium]
MPVSSDLAHSVTFDDIIAARRRIADGVFVTPCRESFDLSDLTGCEIHTKLEYAQRTGSFKERGARNALLLLDADKRRRGVVAASAGNHALALAFHGRQLGIPITVVMPTFAPLVKRSRCERFGARVILHGETIADAKVRGDELVASEGLTYIHGFNDAAIIAGQGTMGIEILEQVNQPDAIIVPIGGAGLIAGVALAVKKLSPRTEIIGVEPRRCPSYYEAMKVGHPVRVQTSPTLADGLAVPEVGDRAFAIARDKVDRVLLVDEEEISLAILRLAELEKGVVEGGGACSLAPFLTGQLGDLRGKRVVLALCGGNIDPTILSRVIEHGLAIDGRLTRFTAVIRDRPGGLASFTSVIADAGASVKQIQHERAFGGPDISTVQVDCTVEVRNLEHIRVLHRALETNGFRILTKSHG